MNSGLLIILISLLGCISNSLNWRYLNYSIVRLLYYSGAIIHESSHAIFCILTGAKIVEFNFFSKQPHVTHYKSKLPFIGEFLISTAPIIGGLLFIFFINKYFLETNIIIPQLNNWQNVLLAPIKIISQINYLSWKGWLLILIFLNMGAMIGPSWQDLKNIWPVIIILLFFDNIFITYFMLLAIILILTNILIQIVSIAIIETIKIFSHL